MEKEKLKWNKVGCIQISGEKKILLGMIFFKINLLSLDY